MSPTCCTVEKPESDEEYTEPQQHKQPRFGLPHTASRSGPCSDLFLAPEPPEPPAILGLEQHHLQMMHDRSHAPGRNKWSSKWGHPGQRREASASNNGVALAEPYDCNKDSLRGMVAMEKVDGVRAFWKAKHPDGPCFIGKHGQRINEPPPSLLKLLPSDMDLDGELWAGRGWFDRVMALMGSTQKAGGKELHWQYLT